MVVEDERTTNHVECLTQGSQLVIGATGRSLTCCLRTRPCWWIHKVQLLRCTMPSERVVLSRSASLVAVGGCLSITEIEDHSHVYIIHRKATKTYGQSLLWG